jgi:hypothetical protein
MHGTLKQALNRMAAWMKIFAFPAGLALAWIVALALVLSTMGAQGTVGESINQVLTARRQAVAQPVAQSAQPVVVTAAR